MRAPAKHNKTANIHFAALHRHQRYRNAERKWRKKKTHNAQIHEHLLAKPQLSSLSAVQ